MFDTPAQLTQDLAAGLRSGVFARGACRFSTPLVIYMAGTPKLVATEQTLIEHLQMFREHHQQQGMAEIDIRLVAEDLSRGRDRQIWTEWTVLSPRRTVICEYNVRLYLERGTDGRFAIHMTEFADPELTPALNLCYQATYAA